MGMTNAEKQAAWRRRQKERLRNQPSDTGYVTIAKVAHAKAMALAEENKRLRARIAELEELRGYVTKPEPIGYVTEPEKPEPEERVEEVFNPMDGYLDDRGVFVVP